MHSHTRWTGIVVGVVMGVLFSGAIVWAGILVPSVGPTAAGSQMVTLEQIYNSINNGTAATKNSTFTEPGTGPTTGTMHTLDEIYSLVGQRAPVPKTGQTLCYDLAGATIPCAITRQDGDLKKGVAWPNPRFTVSNGTVTDNLTGLIWLKNANAFDLRDWATALTDCNTLVANGTTLTDGSVAGDWRLPNVKELQSLIDYAFFNPALSNTAGTGKWVEGNPFTGVQSHVYWSSTTRADQTDYAWTVHLYEGIVYSGVKAATYYVWPVRGGQGR